MAAVLGIDDAVVEEVCSASADTVVPANYNSPGQIVISGTVDGVNRAAEELKRRGAKRVVILAVSGGFHSPCMEPARTELEEPSGQRNSARRFVRYIRMSPQCLQRTRSR